MPYESYYGRKKALGSSKTIIKHFGGGINEILSPINLTGNVIANSNNFYSPDGLAIRSFPNRAHVEYFPLSATNDNYHFCTWNGSTSALLPMFMTYGGSPAKWTAKQLLTAAGTAYDLTSYAMEINRTDMTCGALEFVTQAATYSIYWSALANFFIVQQQTTKTVTSVTLPSGVYPKMMISHMSRVFLLDHKNTLWWCNAGDYTTWYGETPTDSYKALDAGYWFISADDTMNQIVTLGESIFIFGNNTIYRFDGWSDSNFSLARMFSGYGTYPYSMRSLATNNQLVFFVYNDKVYQFNGGYEPILISEPLIVNGESKNGILGGIDPTIWKKNRTIKMRSLFCDKDYLYLYARRCFGGSDVTANDVGIFCWTYMFDIQRKAWWKKDAVSYYNAAIDYTSNQEMDVFPAKEATELSWAGSVQLNPTTFASNVSFVSNTCWVQFSILKAPKPTYYTPYDLLYDPAWFELGAMEVEIDGMFRMSEINVVWRYTDTFNFTAVPPSFQPVYFYLRYDNGADGDRYERDEFDDDDGDNYDEDHYYWYGQTYTDYPKCIVNGVVSGVFDSTSFGLGTGNNEYWQYPQITKFYVLDSDMNNFSKPFMRVKFYCSYPSIEVLRMEFKYRPIGASR